MFMAQVAARLRTTYDGRPNHYESADHFIRDIEIVEHLRDVVLHAYLQDTERAMVLDSAGHYSKPFSTDGPFDSQHFLLQHYTESRND